LIRERARTGTKRISAPDETVFTKCAWRLLPLITAAFIINFLDRTNVGFAALTMNRDLGFAPSVYGLGAGIFFFSYSLFQVPSNLVLHRIGARRWIFCILIIWGMTAAANALISGAASFYVFRFVLGAFEAGFFPGMILYLTYWFPKRYFAKFSAAFTAGNVASFVIGGPLASFVLSLDGVGGLHGWQWLFVLEGLPACLIGFAVLNFLPDGPANASWLEPYERDYIAAQVNNEHADKEQNAMRGLLDPRVLALGIAYGGILFAIYGFGFWLPLLIQGAGFSNSANGLIIALLYVAAIPAMVFWGRSSDRNDERIWHTASAALVAAAALFVASVATNNALMLVAFAVTGVAIYSTIAPLYGVVASFLTGPAVAAGIALINMVGGLLGGFAGQYVIGIIRERTGNYAVALAVVAASLVISASIVFALGRAMASQKIPSRMLQG
jgi:ACS family tartrate transporter-like MFS transporter